MDLEKEDSYESVADNEVIVNNQNSDSGGDFLSKNENENDGVVAIDQLVRGVSEGEPFSKQVQEKELVNSNNFGSDCAIKKVKGLRKWRRIKREVTKEGCVIVKGSKLSKRGFSNTGAQGKAMQFSSEMRESSEGSVSSTRAMVRGLGGSVDGFDVVGDSGKALGHFFRTPADSENSDDHSSKSSTAASIPKMRNGGHVASGHINDRNKIANVDGKNSGSSVQKVPKGKAQTGISKKPRGEQVNIEKEPSHSSMESDSRSVNCVSMQDSRSVTSIGRQNGDSINYGGGNGSETLSNPRQVTQRLRSDYGKNSDGESEDFSQEDLNACSSCSVKEENSENQGCSTGQDDLIESTHMLQSVQEAIEKEIQKFREIGIEDSHADDSSQDCSLPSELMYDGLEVIGSGVDKSPRSLHTLKSEVSSLKEHVHVMEIKLEETTTMLKIKEATIDELEGKLEGRVRSHTNRKEMEMSSELEDLFKQKIEADIEYLTISKTIQDLRVASVDQISQLEEKIVSEQSQIMNKLINAETKAINLKTDAIKLDKHCEDVAIAHKTVKLQSNVCKYTTCFLIQLVLLVVMLGVLISKLSPPSAEVVPT